MNGGRTFPVLIVVVVGILLSPIGPAIGGEPQATLSREEIVATVERGPGPSKGPEDAPVTLVEFSDFQCVYCRKFWQETLPRIDERYIQPGKVRFVYRHLAILGEASVLAAKAAACAHDQGKFWEYHDALFRNSSPLGFTASRLKWHASRSGLDERTFTACLDSGKQAKRVKEETMQARALGANGTPSFLINGQLLIGAYPFEVFQQALDATLAAPRHGPPGRTK
jgi:protein-disulfide isomerase